MEHGFCAFSEVIYLPSWRANSSAGIPSYRIVNGPSPSGWTQLSRQRRRRGTRLRTKVRGYYTRSESSIDFRYTAKWTGLMINIAIGLQVFLGALTTALGSALSGKNVRALMLHCFVICLTFLLDVCCNFNTWWYVNACGVIPGARTGFE